MLFDSWFGPWATKIYACVVVDPFYLQKDILNIYIQKLSKTHYHGPQKLESGQFVTSLLKVYVLTQNFELNLPTSQIDKWAIIKKPVTFTIIASHN